MKGFGFGLWVGAAVWLAACEPSTSAKRPDPDSGDAGAAVETGGAVGGALAGMVPPNDADGDGVAKELDCDDGDPSLGSTASDADCDGVLAAEDCDDHDPRVGFTGTVQSEDHDCDGILTIDDCDDEDRRSTAVAADRDCDGVVTEDDCDDTDPGSTVVAVDRDCDGYRRADDCDDESAGVHPGAAEVCGDEVDENCDGLIEPCMPYVPAACPTFLPLDLASPFRTGGWSSDSSSSSVYSSRWASWSVGESAVWRASDYVMPGYDPATFDATADVFGGSVWRILALNSGYDWSSPETYEHWREENQDVLSVACSVDGVLVGRLRSFWEGGDWVDSGLTGRYSSLFLEEMPLLLPARVEPGVSWRTEGLSLPMGSSSLLAGFTVTTGGTAHTVESCGIETVLEEEREVCRIHSVTDGGDEYDWAVGEGLWVVEDQRGVINSVLPL